MSTKSGYIAIVGRPNVGKSTLLNHILGKKISITSKKPQTTRHRILGIKTLGDTQMLFVDTPGIHKKEVNSLNHLMNQAALSSLKEVDVICFLIDAKRFTDQDQWILNKLKKFKKPVILVVNKMDQLENTNQVLPLLEKLETEFNFAAMVPVSAINGEQVYLLEEEIVKHLPEDVHYYPKEMVTDRNDAFIVSEMVREKLTRTLGQELPYALTVTVDAIEKSEKITRIAAVIWVDRAGQKKIVIGEKGEQLKKVGMQARKGLEEYFGQKVYLNLWVKVKTGWMDNKSTLKYFGYE